jgi:hypothetical protein
LVGSGALSSDASGELHVLRHNCDPLGVNGAEISVFEESNQITFGSLLQGKDGLGLETEIGLVIGRNFPHETLEW